MKKQEIINAIEVLIKILQAHDEDIGASTELYKKVCRKISELIDLL